MVGNELDDFLTKLASLPKGYSEGRYQNRRYGATLSVSADGRRKKLYAEQLGGRDVVSFNLYVLPGGDTCLRSCEIPTDKVIDFILGYQPDP